MKSINISIISAILLIASTTNAVKWGGCPTLNYQDNFDISQYLGTWYEAARMKGTPFENGDCARAEYSKIDDTYVKVFNSGLTADGELDPIDG